MRLRISEILLPGHRKKDDALFRVAYKTNRTPSEKGIRDTPMDSILVFFNTA